MRERPILMNGDMVRAILAETKTQTRRPVKPQPEPYGEPNSWWHPATEGEPQWGAHLSDAIKWSCPFGQPGDRLWVRETWAHDAPSVEECRASHEDAMGGNYLPYYKADASWYDQETLTWRPSIHMPRWACRLVLEIVSVRVEQVKDISDDDARAEGFTDAMAFKDAWEAIYGPKLGATMWGWVWVVEFKPTEASA